MPPSEKAADLDFENSLQDVKSRQNEAAEDDGISEVQPPQIAENGGWRPAAGAGDLQIPTARYTRNDGDTQPLTVRFPGARLRMKVQTTHMKTRK